MDQFATTAANDPNKSFDKSTVATYAGFAFCVFCIWQIFSHTFTETLDHLLTFAAALQLIALATLAVKVGSWSTVEGLSLKMLICYLVSFSLRLSSTLFFPGYLPEDGTSDVYLYQLIEIGGCATCAYLVYMAMGPAARTYDKEGDNMPYWWIVFVVSGVLAVLTHSDANNNKIFDIFWMVSQYLDGFSIIPQLWMVSKSGKVERWTSHFIFWTIIGRVLLGAFWTMLQWSQPFAGWQFSLGMAFANITHFICCADYMYYFVTTIKQKDMSLPQSF